LNKYFGAGQTISGANFFYSKDLMNTVRELTNSAGTIQAVYGYDPFGRVVKLLGSQTQTSDFLYAGSYFHQPSQLNLTLHRAYSANLGRWINRDPLAESAGSNLYAYVHNTPTESYDPQGTDDVGGVIGGVLGGLAGGLGGAGLGAIEGAPLGPGGSTIGGINLGQAGAGGGFVIGWKWGSQFPVGQAIRDALGGFGSGTSAPAGTICQSKKPMIDTPSPGEIYGRPPAEVEKYLIGIGLVPKPSKSGGGTVYTNPTRPGDQVRIMPGGHHDFDPVQQGPYGAVSKGGNISNHIPLEGNPVLEN
jgi:RHS repeat-associated protein